METVSNILYWISTGLLVPVIVLLIFFFVRALLLIGGFFGAWLQMKKTDGLIYNDITRLGARCGEAVPDRFKSLPVTVLSRYAAKVYDHRDSKPETDLLLAEYEIEADKSLSTPRMLSKIGPILGLMGTLIPMGPALVGLATGDIASMAYNMQVAFATTVVGLVISAIGFVILQVRERWFVKNMTVLEFFASIPANSSSFTDNSEFEK